MQANSLSNTIRKPDERGIALPIKIKMWTNKFAFLFPHKGTSSPFFFAHQESQAAQDPRDLQVLRDHPAFKDPLVQEAPMANLEAKTLQVLGDISKGPQAQWVNRESKVT